MTTDKAYAIRHKSKIKSILEDHSASKVAKSSFKEINTLTKGLTDFSIIEKNKSLQPLFSEWISLLKSRINQRVSKGKQQQAKSNCELPETKGKIRVVDEQRRIIRRFLGLHNRQKTGRDLLNLKNAIDRYVKKGLINCQSQYKHLVVEIDKRLLKALKKIEDLSIGITMEIGDQALLCQMVQATGSSEVYPSIRLLNRYLGVHGRSKSEVGEKAGRLLKSIESAIKKQRVRQEDPYFSELMAAQKDLKKFVNTRTNKRLEIKPTSLAGLHGIMGGLGFTDGLGATDDEQEAIWEYQQKEKDYTAQKKSLDQILNSQKMPQTVFLDDEAEESIGLGQIPSIDINHEGISSLAVDDEDELEDHRAILPFGEQYEPIIGRPKGRVISMLYGVRGGGKTTFLLRMARDYANKGKTIAYISNEEIRQVLDPSTNTYKWRMESSLKERVKQTKSQHPNITFFGSRPAQLYQYDLVIVDSVSQGHLNTKDLEDMIMEGANTSFIFIFHLKKDGSGYKGGTEFQHFVDVVWFLDKGEGLERIISVEDKNRHAFQVDGSLIGEGEYRFKLG